MVQLAEVRSALTRADVNSARALCNAALADEPQNPEALQLMGMVFSLEGEHRRAATYLSDAVRLDPGENRYYRDLAVVYIAQCDYQKALGALESALENDPTDVKARVLRARAMQESNCLEAAETEFLELLIAEPNDQRFHLGLGRCRLGLRNFEGAIECADKLLAIDAASVKAHQLMAEVFEAKGNYELAINSWTQAVAFEPKNSIFRARLASAYFLSGAIQTALQEFRQAHAIAGGRRQSSSAFFMALLHDPESDFQTLLKEHRSWAESLETAKTGKKAYKPHKLHRRLRIGYLSGEPVPTPASQFLLPIIRNHDKRAFEVNFYQFLPTVGNVNSVYRDQVEKYVELTATDEEVASRIEADNLDILVDVSGHLGPNTLPILARRLAPVQVSYPTYPCTTGLPEMDYIFTDGWTCPPKMEVQYSESTYRIPSGYLVYEPPDWMPGVANLPALTNGFVTFLLFQRPAKLNGKVWDAVGSILRKLPEARLLMHFSSSDLDMPGSTARTQIVEELQSRGVSAERVSFQGRLSGVKSMDFITQEADIALDSFPYTGQTTTCSCLWMGIPVVTLEGQHHVSRVSAGILRRVGLDGWVATSTENYVDIAVTAANDLSRLLKLRADLRNMVAMSSVSNGGQAALEYEEAYRFMMHRESNGL